MVEEARILLIDEDLFLLDIYARRLRNSGFDVEIATDEEKATRILKENPCDMVVLDVLIGNTPGIDVLERLIKSSGAKDCSFVVLTNSSHGENVKRALELGASGYIVKAHNTPEEVASKLEQIYTKNKLSA